MSSAKNCSVFLLQENPELLKQAAEESLHTYPAALLFARLGFWLPQRQDTELDRTSTSTPRHCSCVQPLEPTPTLCFSDLGGFGQGSESLGVPRGWER